MSEPGTPEHRAWALSRLQQAVRRIALEPRDQIARSPAHVVVADELALELGDWTEVCLAWEYVEGEIASRLRALDDLLRSMSGPEQASRWTDAALARDPGWLRARAMAREVLRVAGWPPEDPPAPEAEDTLHAG